MKNILCISIFLAGSYAIASDLEESNGRRLFATCPIKSISDSTGKYCCPASCGQCGGSGCDKRPGGAGSCCTSRISKSCNISGAPCIAATSSTPSGKCPAGSIADSSGKICCPAACKSCGGSGCNTRPGGAASCCTSQIKKSCSSSAAPCILTSTSNPATPPPTSGKCPAGGLLDSSGKACCSASCGSCGGSGCDKKPGGASACCTSQIKVSCTTGKLPCLISTTAVPTSPPATANDCPAGSIADGSNKACCPASCGVCGGPGCDKRPGGASMCCTSKIEASCSTKVLPCLQDVIVEKGFCSNGMEGYEATIGTDDIYYYTSCPVTVCCPKRCGTCDTSVDCNLADECCVRKIIEGLGIDTDVSCRTNDPPCVVPYPDDECTPNPCQNGARCGIHYGSSEGNCLQLQICECEKLDNYSGEFCELKCGVGETPCGYYVAGYSSSYFETNDRCCTVEEECLKVVGKYGYFNQCFPYNRPKICSETSNPCLNGGQCYLYNYYDFSEDGIKIFLCNCPDGYEGVYCEIKL